MRQSKQNAQQQAVPERSRREPATRERPRTGLASLHRAAGNHAVGEWLSGDPPPPAPRGSTRSHRLPHPLTGNLPGTGYPLDGATRARMEQRFDHDFGGVRLHTGSAAAGTARMVGARAFTVGEDIIFAAAPTERLLAHELAHVVQQAKGGSVPGAAAYAHAEAEAARAASAGAGPVGVQVGVAPGTVQAQDEEEAESGGIGSWILEAIGGEFIDDPTYGQIAVDFVLSIIPYVDQAADARDLVAHIWRLGFRGEYADPLRWIALVFTLIGLVPEVGSAIKSLSKAAIRFVRRNVDEIFSAARRLLGFLPEAGSSFRAAREYIVEHWDEWVRYGRDAWDALLARGSELVDRIAARISEVRLTIGPAIDRLKANLNERLANLHRLSEERLPEAFNTVRERVVEAMDRLAGRERPPSVSAGGRTSDVAGEATPPGTAAGGGGSGRRRDGDGGGGDGDGGPPGGRRYVRHRGVLVDVLEMQNLVRLFRDAIPASSRGRKTVAIGLARDADGDLVYVWSASGNWTHTNLERVAGQHGVMRVDPPLNRVGRGDVGAPDDAEQLLVQGAEDMFGFEVIAIVPSRPACPDCASLAEAENILLLDPP